MLVHLPNKVIVTTRSPQTATYWILARSVPHLCKGAKIYSFFTPDETPKYISHPGLKMSLLCPLKYCTYILFTIYLELISWGPDSSSERGRLLHSCAVTAKKCSQKCDARANLLFCKSKAVVVAKALLWKLHASAYGLLPTVLPTLKHPGPGVYSTCTYDDRVL